MPTLLLVYALLGPGSWIALGVGTYFVYRRLSKLTRSGPQPLPNPPPEVTILIPAKDEGQGVRENIERVLALDYPNFTVLAINDRSIDQTGAILDELAAKYPDRLRVIHIPPDGLPPGWLGKCNALHSAAKHANTPWLLFVDSDVKLEPEVLSVTFARAEARSYYALSLMTRLDCENFLARLVLPLAAASVGAMTRMSQTNEDTRKHIAFANGQFFLIRREAYEKVGGHEAVRDNITEDVALMRLLKRAGYRVRIYFGQQYASTHMHTSLRQMRHGWARIFSGVCERKPWRIFAAMAFVAIAGFSGYFAIIASVMAGDAKWIALSIFHLLVMTAVLAMLYDRTCNPKRLALAFPLGGAAMLALYAAAIRACFTGRIAWRGTRYQAGSATSRPRAASPAETPVEQSGGQAARSHP